MKHLLMLPIVLMLVISSSLAETAAHSHADMHQHRISDAFVPKEPGQGAFASVQEIVELLLSDPQTNWERVDLEALRVHLADMDNVTLYSTVAVEALIDGARFTVTSKQDTVRLSIKNMFLAHSLEMSGTFGWNLSAEEVPEGAVLTVTGPIEDASKIKGLSFIGVMTLGMHHQSHHLAIARGENPH
ncbi:hypothetical protein [Labrenzia sp. PHM005]|uniref:hypothetical protein n=1 Tax=Labrenzia sp. PHM005 TaxID=2590016 RepID=UPI0011404B98|nr:hypothetical protein [Labrenzia sp. PHM005]QDG78182.1 hypothetical protein FJ695_21235 [Labrenzia sp. PHM005]